MIRQIIALVLVTACLGALSERSSAEAHEWRTKKTNKIIKHTHRTKGGHATAENGTGSAGTPAKPVPDEFHKTRRCRIVANVLLMRYPGRTEFGPEANDPEEALTDEELKKLKGAMENTWKAKLGDNWRDKVTQVKDTVGYQSNCGGSALGDDNEWVDPSDMTDVLADDYEARPGSGEGSTPAVGDLVVYKDHTGRIKHIAKVISIGADGKARVRSRMAEYGTWEHPFDTHPDDWTEGGGTRTFYKPKP